MATPIPPDDWTMRLADLLRRDPSERWDEAVQALSTSIATGDAAMDQTRQTILRLLAQRRAQSSPRPALTNPLPDWPGDTLTDLPAFHPAGPAGTSLVATCHDDADILLASLPSWLNLPVDEVLLVDWSNPPQLAAALTAHGLCDPRLRLIQIEGDDLSPAQAFNAGFRLARHQRILALAATVWLGPNYLSAHPLSAGEFRTDPGPADGSALALDIDRRDLAQTGGFNEHLDSADFAVEELAARLTALGLRQATLQTGQTAPPRAALHLGTGSLRATLLHSPDFAALRNRFIAAVLPDWSAALSRAFGLAARAERGLTLRPLAPPLLKPPMHVRADAESHAMIDLVTRHIGGAPVLLSSRRFDIILARPANDTCALDIALAAGPAPELVKTRSAWLVLDISAAALPLQNAQAQTAFKTLQDLTALHHLSLVLRLPADTAPEAAALLSDHPIIAANADLTQGFRPLTLRDLHASPSDSALPHGTMALTTQTVADLAALAQRGPALLLRRPKLFIDAQHGLGNRLRAVASAGAMAWATGRELVIIWQPDVHCDCRYDDLFQPTGAILNHGFHSEATAMDIDLFNYMEVEPGSAKSQPITLGTFRDAYLRSAFPLNSPHSTWASENGWLSRQKPNDIVMDLVNRVRQPNAVSVHIRMEGGTTAEHLPYEAQANWTADAHAAIDHWRKRSHFSHFQARLDQLIAAGQADSVFLASDTPMVYDAFAARYGDRITGQPRPSTDRSTRSLVHALADAILLSSSPRLLGSTWSSFTELANRLATRPITVELCGQDF